MKYVITPKGISERTKLTFVNFMKRKMKEYDELKKELENTNDVTHYSKNISIQFKEMLKKILSIINKTTIIYLNLTNIN